MSQEIKRDVLGNQYVLSHLELQKLAEDGSVKYRYTNLLYGDIHWVDYSDPFRLLIYHADLNQLVFLTNRLSPIGEGIDLDLLTYNQPAGLCLSKNGGFWLLDKTKQQLVLVNKQNQQELAVPVRLFNWADGKTWFHLLEWKNNLYILQPGERFYVFDLYGQQIKKSDTDAIALQLAESGINLISEKK